MTWAGARYGYAIVLCLIGSACAREEMPPGTGPDFEAPSVVEMYPVPGSSVPDFDGDAYVRFDEPLGDPRSVSRTLVASPAWLYDVRAGRNVVRIRPRDGWRPGVVYSFRFPPGLRDLLRNQTRESIDLLFTTGPALTSTSTTGTISDRETVRRVRDVSVLVLGADSIPYATLTDTAGSFAMRSLPLGEYWAFAFRDQNRNRVLDRAFEPHDSGRVSLVDTTTVVRLDLWLTTPDSTPPLLGTVAALDSLRVRLEFDDLLEPEALPGSAEVRITHVESAAAWEIAQFVVGPLAAPETDSVVADSLAVEGPVVDSLRADSIGIAMAEAGGPEAAEDPEPAPEPERSRPAEYATVMLQRPLVPGDYSVQARGFVNLRGLAGGGDTTFVYTQPEPSPSGEAAPEEDAAGEEGTGNGRPEDEGEGPGEPREGARERS